MFNPRFQITPACASALMQIEAVRQELAGLVSRTALRSYFKIFSSIILPLHFVSSGHVDRDFGLMYQAHQARDGGDKGSATIRYFRALLFSSQYVHGPFSQR